MVIPECIVHGPLLVRVVGSRSRNAGKRYVRCEPCKPLKCFDWIREWRPRCNPTTIGPRIDISSDEEGDEEEDDSSSIASEMKDFIAADEDVEALAECSTEADEDAIEAGSPAEVESADRVQDDAASEARDPTYEPSEADTSTSG